MYHSTGNFLSILFSRFLQKQSGYIEYRLIKDKVPTEQKFFTSLEQFDEKFFNRAHEMNSRGWHVYVGVLPRNKENGKAENIEYATTLWVDIDAKDLKGGKGEGLRNLLAFPIVPTMIIDSGHGYHAYWLLEEPLDLRDGSNRARFNSAMQGIITALDGDPAVKDLPRIMRLPGFNNCKDLQAVVPCTILDEYLHPEVTYALDDFASYVGNDLSNEGTTVDISLTHIPAPERFTEVLVKDGRLRATWEGRASMPADNSRSGLDMSLADQLVGHGFVPDEIAAILRKFPHGKGVGATDAYLALTISKAQRSIDTRLDSDDKKLGTARKLLIAIDSQTPQMDIPLRIQSVIDCLIGVDQLRIEGFFADEVKNHFKKNKEVVGKLLGRLRESHRKTQDKLSIEKRAQNLIKDRAVNSGEVMEAMAKTALLPPELVEIAMAVHISSAFRFNPPLWLLIIGVPSSSKTALINLLSIAENSYMLDTLTENAFMSGFVPKNGGETEDLLPKLDGKCFMVKDLTTIFSMNEDTVKKLLGDLTSIFDGEYAKFTATRGELHCKALFSMIGCVTPAILNKHHTYVRQLGPRFFFVAIPELTDIESKKGFLIARRTKKERENDLATAQLLASSFCSQKIEQIKNESPEISFTDESLEVWIEEAAQLLARGRGLAVVKRESFINEKQEEIEYYDTNDVQIEQPWRIYNQLKSLACSLAFLRGRKVVERQDLDTLRSVLISTMPVDRSAVLKQLIRSAGLTAKEIGEQLGRSSSAIRETLKEMEAVGLVDYYLHPNPGETKPPKRYFILEKFTEILQAAKASPEFLEESLNRRKISKITNLP